MIEQYLKFTIWFLEIYKGNEGQNIYEVLKLSKTRTNF